MHEINVLLSQGNLINIVNEAVKKSFDNFRLLVKAPFLFEISQFMLDHFKCHFVSKFSIFEIGSIFVSGVVTELQMKAEGVSLYISV